MAVVIKTDSIEREIEPLRNRPLSFLIQQAGIPLDLQCSGLGICRKCEVKLISGEFLVGKQAVTVTPGSPKPALACQTRVLSPDAEVFVPKTAVLKTEGKIYANFELCDYEFKPLIRKLLLNVPEAVLETQVPDWNRTRAEIRKQEPQVEELSCCLHIVRKLPEILRKTSELTATVGRFQDEWHLIDLEPGDTTEHNLAVAIDIGTTTVAAIMVDMHNGKIIGKASMYNQQMSRADDVASRISVAASSPENLKYMQDLIINDTINRLIDEMCEATGHSHEDIFGLTISGNTVMAHLFLGLSPEGIGALPFQPVTNIYADCLGGDLGLKMHGCGVVYIVPSIAGYIGGDITSDLHVTGLKDTKELTAIVDLGTNSEMVLGGNGEMSAAAAAAGPAFEGAGMQCGCRATRGAIEHIAFDDKMDFDIRTIDNAKAIGICGSAIIDFIACAFRCGLINSMGRFDLDMLKNAGKYLEVDDTKGKTHACVLVPETDSDTGGPVFVSEADVESILKAKGAVYAGLQTLLSQKGYTFKDLKKIHLAGGFAKYIDIDNAITIGMLPEVARDIAKAVGNGSLAGAYLALLDPAARAAYREILSIPKIVSLNMIPEFEMNFVDALMLPNYNLDEFPRLSSGLN